MPRHNPDVRLRHMLDAAREGVQIQRKSLCQTPTKARTSSAVSSTSLRLIAPVLKLSLSY